MFVPWLYLISPAYRNGYGFSQHVAVLMLAPPLVILILIGIKHILLRLYEPFRSHSQKLTWALTSFAILVGIGFFFPKHLPLK